MFSSISERKMLTVRSFLLFGWLTLIASLFWDPFSIALTEPGNQASPFHIRGIEVPVQEELMVSEPYSMGARLFWTMLVPIVPLFLMVFGHEAWRRVCPLSLASQLPGYAGLRRIRTALDRRTGLVRRSTPLLNRQGWIARNSWYIQFGFLFTGITVRLLIINADRVAMGIALLTVICMAITTGFLWGGKTWCNYFCPANVVQKIYTEPGGLLESKPHFSRPVLPQSMCRKPTPKGDTSSCVACTTNCGDIDLQRAYWAGIKDPSRRNVYYMFFGLIIGFYGYYYLYSGGWDYYFSGIWTHEKDIGSKILSPGFYLFDQTIAVPKLIAAPLTLAVACAISLVIGLGLEAIYRRLRGSGLSDEVIRHHCLSVAAWASINAFYRFGGRPNILLLPDYAQNLIDLAILGLTTEWLRRVLMYTPTRYQEEGMASSLLGELKKLKVNVSKFLDGRDLDKLKPNEIFLLSKVLPNYSQQQKLEAYRKILDEAISTGNTASRTAIKTLSDFRSQMNISEQEHMKLLEEIGLSSNVTTVTAEEKEESLNHYRSIVGRAVAGRLESGLSIEEIFKDPSLLSTVAVLRQSLQISDHEHEQVLVEFSSRSGTAGTKFNKALDALFNLRAVKHCLESANLPASVGGTLLKLLMRSLSDSEQYQRFQALTALRTYQSDPEAIQQAAELASLGGADLVSQLDHPVPHINGKCWRDVFTPSILAILMRQDMVSSSGTRGTLRRTERKAIVASLDVKRNLTELLAMPNPVVKAMGLVIGGYLDKQVAKEAAEAMLRDEATFEHPLLVATIERVAGLAAVEEPSRPDIAVNISFVGGDGQNAKGSLSFEKSYVTIGSSAGNDVVLPEENAYPYHAAIKVAATGVRLVRLGEGAIYVDGKPLEGESAALTKRSVVSFGKLAWQSSLTIDWAQKTDRAGTLSIHPILKLVMLAQSDQLRDLPLAALAELAMGARVERRSMGAVVASPEGQWQGFMVSSGQVRLHDEASNGGKAGRLFGPGMIVEAKNFRRDGGVRPKISSEFAIIAHLPTLDDESAERNEISNQESPGPDAGSTRSLETAAEL